ncbi:hypothetical protein VTK26DRAFT_1914 [Humicola hyalothermophila]
MASRQDTKPRSPNRSRVQLQTMPPFAGFTWLPSSICGERSPGIAAASRRKNSQPVLACPDDAARPSQAFQGL